MLLLLSVIVVILIIVTILYVIIILVIMIIIIIKAPILHWSVVFGRLRAVFSAKPGTGFTGLGTPGSFKGFLGVSEN